MQLKQLNQVGICSKNHRYKTMYTITSIQLMQPHWGSQQIVSAPPQAMWGTNNIQYKAFANAHIQVGRHHD